MGTLTEQQREALKSAFDDIDVDDTGSISRTELRTALQLMGQNPTAEEMTHYMTYGSEGEFTREEFYNFVEQHVKLKTPEEIDKELMSAFDVFDADRNQFISREEFRKLMTKMGDEPLTDRDADVLFQSLSSVETDGKLNFNELTKLFMG